MATPAPNHPWRRAQTGPYERLDVADLLDLPAEDFGGEEDLAIPAVELRRIGAHKPLLESGYDPSIGIADELDVCVRSFGTALPVGDDFGRFAQHAPHLGTFLG